MSLSQDPRARSSGSQAVRNTLSRSGGVAPLASHRRAQLERSIKEAGTSASNLERLAQDYILEREEKVTIIANEEYRSAKNQIAHFEELAKQLSRNLEKMKKARKDVVKLFKDLEKEPDIRVSTYSRTTNVLMALTVVAYQAHHKLLEYLTKTFAKRDSALLAALEAIDGTVGGRSSE